MRKLITLLGFLFLFGSAYAQITIDGDMLDWAGIAPLDTDLPAENYGHVPVETYIDFNLVHLYAAHDSDYVYFKIDISDAASFNNFYNFENPPVFELYMDTDIADTTGLDWGWWNNAYDYYVNLAPNLHPDSVNKTAELYYFRGNRMPTYLPEDSEFVFLGNIQMAINDANNQLEVAVPRALVNFGTEFRPWVYSVGNFQWTDGASQLPLEGATHMLKYDFWYGGSVYQHRGAEEIVSEIIIDGDLLDWVSAGIQPADVNEAAEELGDMQTGPEFDVQDIYLTSDSTNLYLRIDINPAATFAGIYNYPNSSAFQLFFDVNWGDTTGLGYGGFWQFAVDYMVDLSSALHPDSTGNTVPVNKYVADWPGAFEEFAEIPEVTATFAKNTEDNVVEIAIPRAGLNMGTDVRPWLYVVGNETWDVEEYVPNTVVENDAAEYFAINYNFVEGASVKRKGDNTITSVGDDYNSSVVEGFGLVQNYPNPFNPSTTIEFNLQQRDNVKIDVYDILGNKITTLVNEEMEPGQKRITWNARNDNNIQMASGMYIYKIVSGKYSVSRKMMLLK